MNDLMWYLSRATGIVATVLAVAALVVGLPLLGARDRRRDIDRPGGSTCTTGWAASPWSSRRRTSSTSYLDADSVSSLASLFVPGIAASQRLAIAWGVVATYLFATTVFTSWPRRLFSRHAGASCTSVPCRGGARVRARLPDGHRRTGRAFRSRPAAARRRRHLHAVHPARRRARTPPSASPNAEIHSWHTACLHLGPNRVRLNGSMERPSPQSDAPASLRADQAARLAALNARRTGSAARALRAGRRSHRTARRIERPPRRLADRRSPPRRRHAARHRRRTSPTSVPAPTCRTRRSRGCARPQPRLDRRTGGAVRRHRRQASAGNQVAAASIVASPRPRRPLVPGSRRRHVGRPTAPVSTTPPVAAATDASSTARCSTTSGATSRSRPRSRPTARCVDVTTLQTPYSDGKSVRINDEPFPSSTPRRSTAQSAAGRHRLRRHLHQQRLPPLAAVRHRRRQRGRDSLRSPDVTTAHRRSGSTTSNT